MRELPYGELTEEEQAVVRMWLALKLPMQWRYDDSDWEDEDDHAYCLNELSQKRWPELVCRLKLQDD